MPQRWLPGMTWVAPLSAVKSSIAQISDTPSVVVRGRATR